MAIFQRQNPHGEMVKFLSVTCDQLLLGGNDDDVLHMLRMDNRCKPWALSETWKSCNPEHATFVR